MSLLRPPKHPSWLPRYSRPAGPGSLLAVLILVALLIWFLMRLA
jgi:hypothetical protein